MALELIQLTVPRFEREHMMFTQTLEEETRESPHLGSSARFK